MLGTFLIDVTSMTSDCTKLEVASYSDGMSLNNAEVVHVAYKCTVNNKLLLKVQTRLNTSNPCPRAIAVYLSYRM